MAKINPVKIKQDADKLEKGGRLDQAIVLYRQVVEDNPRDWNTINKIGDLYAKTNKVREASQEYAKVADFYAKDGFLLKAIAIWRKINKLDTSAPEPYLSLADLYAKQGLVSEAKSHYQIVADEYIKRGKAREAGDVLKKMAEIDPGDLKVRSKLADLYTREGSAGKAVDEHIAIAEELHKKGHLAEALQVLEKGLKLDPSSGRLRSELARVHLVQRNYDKAAAYLQDALKSSPNDAQILARLGEAHLGAKKIAEAEGIFKRLLALNPGDDDARAQMARVYLQQGQLDQAFDHLQPVVARLLERRDAAKAATLLQQIVQKNPSHAKSLQKLADVYRVGGNETALVTTYSQLAEAYINQKDFAQAATALEALVQREPQNQQHRTKLDFVRSKLGGRAAGAPAPAPAAEPLPELIEEEFDLSPAEPASDFELAAAERAPARVVNAPVSAPARTTRPAARPAIESSGPLSDDDKEFIEEHLGEGRVFRKYGLIDKAADQFEAVIARFPDNVDARKELLDVYKEKGLAARVAEQSLALAEIFRLKGDSGAAETYEAEARRLAPEAVPAKAPAPPAAPRPAARPAAPPAPAAKAPADEGELMLEEQAVPLVASDEEEISLDVEEQAEAAAPAPAEETSIDLGVEVGGDQEMPARFFEDEAAAAPASEEIAIESSPGEDLVLEEEEPAPHPPPPPLKAAPPKPAPARPAPAAAPSKAAPPRAPAAPAVPADLQRMLEEVEQYVSLGFIDDAKEALREVSARHLGHPAIQAQLAQLGLDLTEEPEAAPARSVERSRGDLGAEEPAETSDLVSEPPAGAAPDLSAGDSGLDLSDGN